MIIDLLKEHFQKHNSYDTIIMGSGPAGITVARKLAQAGNSVLLLEAGGLEKDEYSEKWLSNNSNSGRWYAVDASHLIQLGGTSGHWAGNCAPLDQEDFRGNELYGNWPITESDLQPYYLEVEDILDLGKSMSSDKLPKPIDYNSPLQEKQWRFSPPTRFGEKYKGELQDSQKITVLLHAVVYELIVGSESVIKGLKFKTVQGENYEVSAKNFVLACGGLESPKLLLENSQLRDPMGSAYKQVGKYFADHVHLNGIGTALLYTQNADSARYEHFKIKEKGYAQFFQFTKGYRKLHALPNMVFRLEWEQELNETGKKLKSYYAHKDFRAAALTVMGEHKPNADSFIRLKEGQSDLYGRPKLDLHWQYSEDDLKAYRKSIELFASQFGAQDLGRIWLNEKYHQEALSKQLYGGYHHMGTLRMAESSENGVCDKDAKVHGLSNLYVAGSALFSTYGCANPTFTIVALSLRLAKHLREKNTLKV